MKPELVKCSDLALGDTVSCGFEDFSSAVVDAMADAETLRLYHRGQESRQAYETWAAGSWGNEFRRYGWLGAVVLAAHAAFRACPGLRGE